MKIEHWSDCAINALPAKFPMPCSCGGIRGGKQSERESCPEDYSLAERAQMFHQLWQYRIFWKHENHASLVEFLLTIAKHSALNRNLNHNMQTKRKIAD